MSIIDPELVNLKSLPFVSIEDRHLLPDSQGIYFVIDADDKIQYIGKVFGSKGFCKRWENSRHHRYDQLIKLESVKIAYLETDNIESIDQLEKDFIALYKPILNKTAVIRLRPEKQLGGLRNGFAADNKPITAVEFCLKYSPYSPLDWGYKKHWNKFIADALEISVSTVAGWGQDYKECPPQFIRMLDLLDAGMHLKMVLRRYGLAADSLES